MNDCLPYSQVAIIHYVNIYYTYISALSLSPTPPAIIGFEQSSYTIIEGESGTICVEIKEPVKSDIHVKSSVTVEFKDGTASEIAFTLR